MSHNSAGELSLAIRSDTLFVFGGSCDVADSETAGAPKNRSEMPS